MLTLSRSVLATLFVLLLPACAIKEVANKPSTLTLETRVELNNEPLPKMPAFMLRGTLVLGSETNHFVPCGSNKQYWLEGEKAILGSMFNQVTTPYEPLYAEIVGHLSTAQPHQVASDYQAKLTVSAINLITRENSEQCLLPPRATRAFGNEPSWSVSIRHSGGDLKLIDKQSPLRNKNPPQINAQSRVFEFEQSTLLLERDLCKDGMSDSIYGWSAIYRTSSGSNTGCATLANLDATAHWVKHYVASSTQSKGFGVELYLAPDHSATTMYIYSDGAPTKESGFWQQINKDQVYVVMTHHQGQRLIAERIFTLQDGKLIAEKEKVAGRVYTIFDGGLVLFPQQP